MATFSGARVIGGQLKLRKTASQSAVVLAYIPNNTSINVSDYDDTWLSCMVNSRFGGPQGTNLASSLTNTLFRCSSGRILKKNPRASSSIP